MQVTVRDAKSFDDEHTVSPRVRLFDNCMLALTEGITAKDMRAAPMADKEAFVQNIIGRDIVYDAVIIAKRNGYIDFLKLSTEPIDPSTIMQVRK